MASALTRILRRPYGKGWLILSGGQTTDGNVLRVLALIDRAGSAVAVVPAPCHLPQADETLSPWLDRLGWPGNAIDCDSDVDMEEKISEASLILLPDLSGAAEYAGAFSRTDAGQFILGALDEGAIIVAEGVAAESLGEVVETTPFSSGGSAYQPGLGWVPGACIQAHFSGARDARILARKKALIRIGIPPEAAIALGPDDQRELWGGLQPTITFGSEWVHGS
jgi:hypothetical protein